MRSDADLLFMAIAHGARRAVLDVLVDGRTAVAELQTRTALSPSALSQHLRVLKEAGLVESQREGKRIFYVLTPAPLLEVVVWARDFEHRWNHRLDDLAKYLDETIQEDQR